MFELVHYVSEAGVSSFGEWFGSLDVQAALKVRTVLARMEVGNLGDAKPVGEGVLERRIDWGPGYRIYYGREGDKIIVLLAGGTKKRQAADIKRAQECWSDYRRRRKERRWR